MKKLPLSISYTVAALSVSFLLSGCSLGSVPTTADQNSQQEQNGATEEKRGDTTKTGTILNKSGIFFIETAPGKLEAIDSLAVDLAAYEDQQVTIVGQYSGDTLFVGKVQ